MDSFLEQSCKRIQTTMIGALSKMENNFGHLWGHFGEGELSSQEELFADLWDETRNSILNQGNKEIRNLKQEYLKAKIKDSGDIPLTIKDHTRLQTPKD
tara:strand:+ start:538 stop:834 length:297 start_codon:yes stop_codon:yes gene_type:complete